MIRFVRRWYLELGAAVAAALSLFLLFEQRDLGRMVLAWLAGVIAWGSGVVRLIHVSDVLGVGLLILSVVLLVMGSARRIQRSPKWSARACPVCGRSLRRTRRRPGDVLTRILPLRRFYCPNCGWTGLRAKTPGDETEEITEQPLAVSRGHR